jgi:hypothetical protein
VPAGHDALPPRPAFEGAFHTATGGEILIVQYPGPTTGERADLCRALQHGQAPVTAHLTGQARPPNRRCGVTVF